MLLFNRDGISLTKAANGIHTLAMDRGENRFNPLLIADLSEAVAKVQSAGHPKALVITGVGKFLSNGLDTDWMSTHNNPSQEETSTPAMVESVYRLLAKILVMDCRTVAAINGHAFGAGLFLALACDFRVMRTKRGYVNFPELNLGMPLSVPFAELAKAKCSGPTLREAVLTGKRYGSRPALQAGLVDFECAVEDLPQIAKDVAKAGFAESLGVVNFHPANFSQMKIELYTDAYHALTTGRSSTSSSPLLSRL
jgi:enoyl-CoA hydratase/carnithine racemase